MFLETITGFGDNILVPINKINFVKWKATSSGSEINIAGEDFDLVECFTEEKKAQKRYDMIKKIIEAA